METTICGFYTPTNNNVEKIKNVILSQEVTMITKSFNGVVRIWSGEGYCGIDQWTGHVDSMGRNLLAHINGDTDSIMGTILTILAQLNKAVTKDTVKRIEVYKIVKS